jgi:hypothetical protein
MRTLSLLFLAFFLVLVSSCKKDKSAANNNNNNNLTSPYYFNFTLNGTSYKFNDDFPQYISFYTNEIGGYQVANGSVFPSVGLSFNWPEGDTVRESDIMGLVGKTFYFYDTTATNL